MPLLRNLVLLFSLALPEQTFASALGYLQDGRFFPLIVTTPSSFASASSTTTITGTLRNAFRATKESYVVRSAKQYEDAFTDEWWVYGELPTNVSKREEFYTLGARVPGSFADRKTDTVMSFYRFFANDKWGRHLIDNRDWLKLGPSKIAENSNVRAHYVTDLDTDGLREIWLTYVLMYGEVGRMIFEESGGGQWKQVVNHCYSCD